MIFFWKTAHLPLPKANINTYFSRDGIKVVKNLEIFTISKYFILWKAVHKTSVNYS